MKTIHAALLLLLLVLCASCLSTTVSKKQLMSIQQGMTRKDVIRILGAPDYRRFDGDVEELEFRRTSNLIFDEEWKVIIVRFIDGEVIGMDTFDARENPLATVAAPPPPMGTVILSDTQGRWVSTGNRGLLYVKKVMERKDFERFLDAFKYKTSDRQMKMIDKALIRNGFTSAQCMQVVKEINSINVQEAVMKRMYPRIADKENFQKVIDSLAFPSLKAEMKNFVREYQKY